MAPYGAAPYLQVLETCLLTDLQQRASNVVITYLPLQGFVM